MPDPTITPVDTGSLIHKQAEFRDDVITFAGADTFAAGTILARSVASGKLILYVKGGSTDGNGVPKAILTYPITATGAGDKTARVAIKGEFRKDKLVIDADGDDSNIDNAVRDLLRDYGMIAVDVTELNTLDNQ